MRMAPARKKKTATNLSVSSDLVRRAKALGLNMSEVLEQALELAIKDSERQDWLESNREAISSYNDAVGERGVFSDGWRRF